MNAVQQLLECRRSIADNAPLYAVLGDPIGHSLSPRIHTAALAHHGIDGRYVALRCRADELAELLNAAKTQGVVGLNLTKPLKTVALPLLDRVDRQAAAIEAVNTVVFEEGRSTGWNTDVGGFADAVAAEGLKLRGVRAVVIGGGGAARAALMALASAGASRVELHARRIEQARAVSRLASETATVVERPGDCSPEADLVVNATPLGLDAQPGSPDWQHALSAFEALPWNSWSSGRRPPFVFDMNYQPRRTALIHLATSAGCPATNGLTMLLMQAERSFALWTGLRTPVEILARTLRSAL